MANDPASEKFDDLCAKANILEKEKKYEEAIQLWKEAIKLKPEKINPYLDIRYFYLSEYHDFDNALDIMLQMINNVPDVDPRYYIQIGYLYLGLKDNDNGLMYYQKANKLFLENLSKMEHPLPENYFEVGCSYHALKDYQNAMEYYRKFYYNLQDNLIDETKGFRNDSLFLSTAKKIYLMFRTICYDDTSYWDVLNNYYSIMAELNNVSIEDKTILYSITTLSTFHNKCFKRIIRIFESIESMKPEIWPDKIPDIIFECIASAYWRDDPFTETNFQKLRCLVLKQLHNDPLNENIYFYFKLLSGIYFLKYQQPLFPEGKPPDNFTFIETASPEEFKTIEDTLLKRFEQSPDNVEILYILGVFYDIKKEYENAIKYFEQAIELDSNYPKAYKKLSKFYGLGPPKTEESLKTGIKYGEKYLSLQNDEDFEKWDFRFMKERLEKLDK